MSNRLYIGGRNCGKTSSLCQDIKAAQVAQRPVVVVDSATEHKNRSIYHRLLERLGDDCVASEYPRGDILPSLRLNQMVSRAEVGKVVMFDVAFYLEQGHRMATHTQKIAVRHRYLEEAEEILEVVLASMRCGRLHNVLLVLDEIELTSKVVSMARMIADRGGEVYAALHPPLVNPGLSLAFECVVLKSKEEQ